MKIAIFTEGTILMHGSAIGHTRDEIIQQILNKEPSVKNYGGYVPIGNAVGKVKEWANHGAKIIYITSRKDPKETEEIQNVLNHSHFPEGSLEYRIGEEKYKDVAERIAPNVLVEDDCESMGGENEIIYSHIDPDLKGKIKSVIVKEFAGVDHLSGDISVL